LQPAQRKFQDVRLIEPMKRFADGDEFDGTILQLQILRSRNTPGDVRQATRIRLLFADGNHLGFDIDRQYVAEVRRHRDRDAARSTRKIEQQTTTCRPGPRPQISQQLIRVRRTIAMVISRGAGKGRRCPRVHAALYIGLRHVAPEESLHELRVRLFSEELAQSFPCGVPAAVRLILCAFINANATADVRRPA
jgi:hypothetical protein